MGKPVDLHLHSSCSDGDLPVLDLVALAYRTGLTALAIADHDTIAQVEPSFEIGKAMGIKVVAAVEMSVDWGEFDLHLLGYRFDPRCEPLSRGTERIRLSRTKRALEMVAKLQTLGFVADVSKLRLDSSVGKPQVAKLILEESANQSRLREVGITASNGTGRIIDDYLNKGKPAYVGREKFSLSEAISLIHDASGLAVLAHPWWSFRKAKWDCAAGLEKLKALGIDGVEVHYTSHTKDQTLALHEQSKRLGLIETAGSDFHGLGSQAIGTLGVWEDYGLSPDFSAIIG